MPRYYTCWRCQSNNKTDWYTEEQLIKRRESYRHTDYVCPVCESVVICMRLKDIKRR